ncbi:SDR family NAD(P)-dependent oxidoreductase [Curtobacterium sp. Csp1]|uniref:SDR family NAD(P)-dependent oxidoreductase n=1 Tax=Curtobacterium sp. Csp1 TaxID=2495429 RepID=UPI0034A0B984
MPRRPIEISLPRLDGQTAVVTGASDGIGLGIATALAGAGAAVVLPVRNTAKGEAARAQVLREHPGASVTLGTLDLSSLDSVRAFARSMVDAGTPVDLLVGNAGVMTPPERQTPWSPGSSPCCARRAATSSPRSASRRGAARCTGTTRTGSAATTACVPTSSRRSPSGSSGSNSPDAAAGTAGV